MLCRCCGGGVEIQVEMPRAGEFMAGHGGVPETGPDRISASSRDYHKCRALGQE